MDSLRTNGPKNTTNGTLAAIIGILFFLLMLSFETQAIAHRAGYWPGLGSPLFGHIYNPLASYGWMFDHDVYINILAGMGNGSILEHYVGGEAPWMRQAFADERRRFPWEVGSSGIVYIFAFVALAYRRRPNSDLYGGARWATLRDLLRSTLTRTDWGIVLGEVPWFLGKRKLLIHDGYQNVLAIGPPGEGKSDGIARPTLARTWLHSAIVFDPAGQLAPQTANLRRHFSHIAIFDPRSPTTVRYNPLEGIASGDVDAVRTIMSSYLLDRDLSEMTEQEQYFTNSARELGTALVLRAVELGTPTLAAATNLYYDTAWEKETDFLEALLTSQIAYVTKTASKFLRMHERQVSPIISTLTQKLDIFRSPSVEYATSASTIAPMDLRERSTTLYLTVRERDHASLNPLMRLVFTRFLDDLTDEVYAPRAGKQKILILCDEFPLLRAPIIQQKLATMRKFDMQAVLLAQTLTQMQHAYGHNETISGTCDVRVIYPTLDFPTQTMASHLCGTETRWSETTSRDSNARISRSIGETSRQLLQPSELADLKAHSKILVYHKGEPPIKAYPVHAHDDPRFNCSPTCRYFVRGDQQKS